MKRLVLLVVSLVTAASLCAAAVPKTSYVNPFVGTRGYGHAHPAAMRPFGMVQAGPDNGRGWPFCSGYNRKSKSVRGFSQRHLSGTGIPDYGEVSLLPFRGAFAEGLRDTLEDEFASPGYYRTRLGKADVAVEVTATPRTAFYKFTPMADGELEMLVDPSSSTAYGPFLPKFTNACASAAADRRSLGGSHCQRGWGRIRLGWTVVFDRPAVRVTELPPTAGGAPARFAAAFAVRASEPLLVKVALSVHDAAGAAANLRAENPGWDFAAVHAAAEADWERHLSRVEAEGPDADKRTFYSMLYRALGQPNLMSDVGEDDLYTTFSIWDGCRAAFPLYALVAPERIPAFVRSFMRFYRQHGWMPVFCIGDWDTQCMIGTHSVAILERWRECGLGADTDWAAVCAAVVDTLRNCKKDRQKGRWDILDRYGYLPYDKIPDEGVSRTMEACLDDAAAARMCRAFGRSADAAFLAARAGNWTNVFDRALLLARGRDSKGAWREPFQPFANGCASRMRCDFCEANAYTYTWHVMQDVEGLVAVFGGKAVFGERLDAVFSLPTDVPGCARDGDVTGLIGQYPHGCDAAHHIPYCFRFSDRPWRTDELVGEICRRFYSAKDDGLCGNDDCGELSGWYVFAAAGFFPLDPSDSNYVVGSPQLDGVTFHLPDGKTFAVRRRGRSVAGKVPTVLLNGVSLATWRFPHAAVAAGGELTVSYR